jgi:hypothetical protein
MLTRTLVTLLLVSVVMASICFAQESIELKTLFRPGGGDLWSDNGTYIYPTKAGNTTMVITKDGEVGIGTTGPKAKLDIKNGGLVVGNASGGASGNMGPGTINVADGFYVNGAKVEGGTLPPKACMWVKDACPAGWTNEKSPDSGLKVVYSDSNADNFLGYIFKYYSFDFPGCYCCSTTAVGAGLTDCTRSGGGTSCTCGSLPPADCALNDLQGCCKGKISSLTTYVTGTLLHTQSGSYTGNYYGCYKGYTSYFCCPSE